MSRAVAAGALLALAACGRFGFSPDAGDATKLAGSDAISDGPPDGTGFPADWWDTAYAHRSRIDIHGSMLDTGVTDFPLYVHLDPSEINLGAANAAGSDLRFIGSDGQTVLDYDIELADGGGFDVWVRIPEIRGRTVDDVAWVYYGNPAAVAPMSGENVWSGPYVGVYHMVTDRDATQNHNDGVYTGTLVAAGLTRAARQMTVGTAHGYLTIPDSASLDSLATAGSATWEAWIGTAPDASVYQSIIEKDVNGGGEQIYQVGIQTDGTPSSELTNVQANNAGPHGSMSIIPNVWTLVALTWATDGSVALWEDGALIGTGQLARGLDPDTVAPTVIGAGCSGCGVTPNVNFNLGSIDEVRIETISRDRAWFDAEHANLFQPQQLVTVTPADP